MIQIFRIYSFISCNRNVLNISTYNYLQGYICTFRVRLLSLLITYCNTFIFTFTREKINVNYRKYTNWVIWSQMYILTLQLLKIILRFCLFFAMFDFLIK